MTKNGRVFQEEYNVADFGLEARVKIREGTSLLREVLATLPLIVVQPAHRAKLKLTVLHILLLYGSLVLLFHGVRFRGRVWSLGL